MICIVPDCRSPIKAAGLCGRHYERRRVHGDVTVDNRSKPRKVCRIDGCHHYAVADGICQTHYSRRWRHGSTDSLLPNYGSHKSKSKQGYIREWTGQRYAMEHVLIVEQALGKLLPPKAVVHHFDLDPTNNTPTNLVVCPDQAYHFLLHRRQRALWGGKGVPPSCA
jgi:hypothetical protein